MPNSKKQRKEPSPTSPQLNYVQYQSDKESLYLPAIRQLISKDLSEPYSIYVYRYFLYQWGDLCFMVCHLMVLGWVTNIILLMVPHYPATIFDPCLAAFLIVIKAPISILTSGIGNGRIQQSCWCRSVEARTAPRWTVARLHRHASSTGGTPW